MFNAAAFVVCIWTVQIVVVIRDGKSNAELIAHFRFGKAQLLEV